MLLLAKTSRRPHLNSSNTKLQSLIEPLKHKHTFKPYHPRTWCGYLWHLLIFAAQRRETLKKSMWMELWVGCFWDVFGGFRLLWGVLNMVC